MNRCCTLRLWSGPKESDKATCPTCGGRWIAIAKPHVGVPTWWAENGSNPEQGPVR